MTTAQPYIKCLLRLYPRTFLDIGDALCQATFPWPPPMFALFLRGRRARNMGARQVMCEGDENAKRERQRSFSSHEDSAAVHICLYISRAPVTKAKETLYTQKGSTGWLLNKHTPVCVAFKLNQSFIFTHCVQYERESRKFLIFTSFIYQSKG